MSQAITPKPYKRYCPREHDTWVVGRVGDRQTCKECMKIKNKEKAQRDKVTRLARNKSQYVPELRDLRIRRGYSLNDLSLESRVDLRDLVLIELGKMKATYPQRVQIFQAINVLEERKREEMEKLLEDKQKLIRAGIA